MIVEKTVPTGLYHATPAYPCVFKDYVVNTRPIGCT